MKPGIEDEDRVSWQGLTQGKEEAARISRRCAANTRLDLVGIFLSQTELPGIELLLGPRRPRWRRLEQPLQYLARVGNHPQRRRIIRPNHFIAGIDVDESLLRQPQPE